CELRTRPGYSVSFVDRNGDLDRYELDCGAGGEPVTSAAPITEACRYTQPGDYDVKYAAVDQGGRRTEVTSAIHVLYPLRLAIAYPEGLVTTQDAGGFDLVELPAAGATDRTLTVTTLSDNGVAGYDEGNGVIQSSYYSVTYRAGNTWWSQRLAGGTLPAGGGVDVPLTKPGTYDLWVSAADARGMGASFSRVFKVTAPFDVDLRVNGKSPKELATSGRPWFMAGDSVTFAAVDTLIPEGVGAWDPRFAWSVDGAEASTARSFTTALTAGIHTVRLVALNAVEAVAREVVREVAVTVYENLTVGFTPLYQERVPGEVSLGDRYDLGLALDPGENVQGGYWSVTRLVGGVPVASTQHRVIEGSDYRTRSFVFTQEGTYQITATVWDDRGVLTTRTFGTNLVVKSYPPVIASLAADRTTVRPGDPVTVTAAVTDPDARAGEVLAYHWYVNGTFVRSTTVPSFTHAFAKEGAHRVTLEVFDVLNQTDAETVTVAAQYQPPAIQELRVDRSSGVAPLTASFTAVATDPDGTVAAYAWDVGADGTVEGTEATFQHVFAIGTYIVRLTVTDNDGKTAQANRTIRVLDPNADTVTFEFKELRSNGFGPAYDFSQAGGEYHGEGLSAVASTPVDDVNVRPENLTPPASTMIFAGLGFYGSHSEHWGSPSTLLFQVTAAGTYDVGMRGMGTQLPERTVTFPASYACGYLVYTNWASSFGVYPAGAGQSSQPFYPAASSVTTDGVVKVLALLGNELVPVSPWQNRCVPSYYGFVTGSGANLVLSETTALVAKPLQAPPDGYALQAVTFDVGDGIDLTLSSTDLDRDGSGRYLIPALPAGTYYFRYSRPLGDRYWQVEFRVGAAVVAAAVGEIALDFGAVQDRDDLTVTNTVANDSVTLVWESPAVRVSGTVWTNGGVGAVGVVPALAGADATVAVQYSGGAAAPGFFRKTAVAGFDPVLDFASPGIQTTLERLDLTVDPTAKTLTVDLGSTTGDACFLRVDGTYQAGSDYRNRSWSFATDGSKTSYTLEYAIPESSVTYPDGFSQVFPAIDALTGVTAEAYCTRTALGYEGLLREILTELETYGFDPLSLAREGALSEGLRRSATWPQP
ncbi:MAG: PKD domain-containing protein, partial [Deferrisomatales bacterium]